MVIIEHRHTFHFQNASNVLIISKIVQNKCEFKQKEHVNTINLIVKVGHM